MSATTTPDEIIDLWYSDRVKPLWFNSTKAFDEELQRDYGDLVEAALAGKLSVWEETPQGALALVILLDQFPLNMYRGQAKSFAGEALSRDVAERAIARGLDKALTTEQATFLYMPFMHSENLADQDRAIALFEAAGLDGNLKWAHHHREIIRRFGRFPHRNKLLNRNSTAEEVDYLNSKAAFTG